MSDEDGTPPGGTIIDPFGGSGTALIAASESNRVCYMMEIEPVYCDVIIRRWESNSGQKAEKLHSGD